MVWYKFGFNESYDNYILLATLLQAQNPIKEDITKLKEDIKQEMMVCVWKYCIVFSCILPTDLYTDQEAREGKHHRIEGRY